MSFFQKIKDGAAKAADKAQKTVETTKLSAQISRKRKELKDNFTEIGASVYKAFQAGNLSLAEPEITRLSRENEAIEAVIASLHLKISQLNDERLCVCGHSSAADAAFCPACGRKLESGELHVSSAAAAATAAKEELFHEDLDQPGPEEWTENWTEVEETPIFEGIDEIRCGQCQEELRQEDAVCPRCGALHDITRLDRQ